MKPMRTAACFFLAFASLIFGQVGYDSEVQPIFDDECVYCHGGTSGVTVTGYEETMASVGDQYGTLIVAPGDTGASPLWDKINPDPQYGIQMPKYGQLTQEEQNTIGRWILEGANETPTAAASAPAEPAGFALIGSWPNPFNPTTTVQFALAAPSTVTLSVYDLKGRPVHTHTAFYGSGPHAVPLMLSHLVSGMYVIRLQAVSGNRIPASRTMKVMLMK